MITQVEVKWNEPGSFVFNIGKSDYLFTRMRKEKELLEHLGIKIHMSTHCFKWKGDPNGYQNGDSPKPGEGVLPCMGRCKLKELNCKERRCYCEISERLRKERIEEYRKKVDADLEYKRYKWKERSGFTNWERKLFMNDVVYIHRKTLIKRKRSYYMVIRHKKIWKIHRKKWIKRKKNSYMVMKKKIWPWARPSLKKTNRSNSTLKKYQKLWKWRRESK